ncbi:tyrosine-type recombinase/integrase [Yinghuangia sp. YIM S09857]|uniref:tyrosine-type recombinase/integrase n=1 Tax=Yinghuangia sp. YIM S09857 TaxID=3436929 RepID=UPI003F52E418
MPKKRQFGRLRKLPSGRYQARYKGPDGIDRPAPLTFARKKDAEEWLAEQLVAMRRGGWIDPDAGKIPLGEYATKWIAERGLSPRTVELYQSLLRLHIAPTLGDVYVSDITPSEVRGWRAGRLGVGVGASTVAKAYAFMRAVLTTAVQDELIRRNPCQIKGGSKEHTPERPIATVADVYALAGQVPRRFRALVLVAALLGLRWGELIALTRDDVDVNARTVRIRASVAVLRNGQQFRKLPKSAAGVRTVVVPAVLVPELRWHIECYAEPGRDGRLFVGAKGATPRANHFHKLWHRARTAVGMPHLHFHDLRHTGNMLAAAAGANTREMMTRMGHSTARAALIYQHATDERQRLIADALSNVVTSARRPHGHDKGTSRG